MQNAAMQKSPREPSRRDAYHHGNLRQALVDAARKLVIERGAENFSLSDACRAAGVSTAAPYKHFRDKDEIIMEVIKQGFDEFDRNRSASVTQHAKGSLAGIVAMGLAYLDFARKQPAVFRLMFGQNPRLNNDADVISHGRACFKGVVDDVAAYCDAHQLREDSLRLALELWTFVHGAASLLIDEDYQKVAPGVDVDALVRSVTPRILQAR